MIKISTPLLLTAELTNKKEQQVSNLPDFAEPGNTCINTILNYSKSLEVRKSKVLKNRIDITKS